MAVWPNNIDQVHLGNGMVNYHHQRQVEGFTHVPHHNLITTVTLEPEQTYLQILPKVPLLY